MSEPRKLVRIGELLTVAGILTQEQLKEALCRAAETDLPLGKILVWSGYVTDEILRSAVHVQCLLNDKAIPLEGAVAWLAREAGKEAPNGERRPLESVESTSNRLGELLFEAGMVREPELDEALADSLATGLPLGRILVYTKNLPDLFISAALDAQVAIREQKINREAAIDALRLVHSKSISFDKALKEMGFATDHHGFSQIVSLLRASGVMSEPKLATAQEMALVKGRTLPDILIDFRFLPEKVVLVATQACHDLIADKIPMGKAVGMIKRAVENNLEPSDTNMLVKTGPAISAADLLKLARLVDSNEIRKVSPPALLNSAHLRQSKDDEEKANVDQTLTIALKCVDLIDKNILSLEQAIVVLHYCCRKGLGLPTVLTLIGVHTDEVQV
ncbi:MAG TPA: hypothetical protein V6D22_12480 [Candidatus Obscuribacterales bacterium]